MTELNKTRLVWSVGALLVVGAIAAAVVVFVILGGFDTAATAKWPQPIAWAIHRTMINSSQVRSADIAPPSSFTPDEVRAGFELYDARCAMCHGGPGVGRQPWLVGMDPTPPYLIDVRKSFGRAQLYWIIRNGVRMSGMPAWKDELDPGQTWDLVAFLEALPGMTPQDYARLRAGGPPLQRAPTKPGVVGAEPRDQG